MSPANEHQCQIPQPATAFSSCMGWLALGLTAFGMLARAFTSHEPMPGFGFDPMVHSPPPVGMGPTASLMLDAVTLLGAALVLWSEQRAARTVRTGLVALGMIGALVALAHGLVFRGLNLEALRLGASWSSAVIGAIALWHAARFPVYRRALAGLLLGAVMVLMVKGGVQVLIEHPATLERFKANRETMLAAQGMRPSTPQAMAFERRLSQPDPTGWFGLTNVYFSLIVASGLAAAIMIRSAWKPAKLASDRGGLVARFGLLALLGGCVLLVALGPAQGGTIAKGPMGALVLSIALLAMGKWCCAHKVPIWWIGLAAVCVPIAAVVARGLAGDALGELSLRFRWFYLIGAAKVVAEHPLIGVGPDGFQAAYLLAKPTLSPEQVASPHSIIADWLSTLGVAGTAWTALLIAGAASLGARLRVATDASKSPSTLEPSCVKQSMVWMSTTLGAMLIWNLVFEEWPIAANIPGGMVLMVSAMSRQTLIGMVALAGGLGVVRFATDSGVRTALVGAALVVLSHAQIEMVLSNPGSVAWALALLAVASSPHDASHRSSCGRPAKVWAFGLMLMGVGLIVAALGPVRGWEVHQRTASERVARVTRIEQELTALAANDPPESAKIDQLRARARSMAQEAGLDGSLPIAELIPRVKLASAREAIVILGEAAVRGGEPLATLNELSSLSLSAGALAQSLGEDPFVLETGAIEAARRATTRWPDRTSGWNTLARAYQSRWHRTGDSQWADQAVVALEHGQELDPDGMPFVWALFELAQAREDDEGARRWAKRCLEVDQTLVLDPLVQLSEDRRRRLRRAVGDD